MAPTNNIQSPSSRLECRIEEMDYKDLLEYAHLVEKELERALLQRDCKHSARDLMVLTVDPPICVCRTCGRHQQNAREPMEKVWYV